MLQKKKKNDPEKGLITLKYYRVSNLKENLGFVSRRYDSPQGYLLFKVQNYHI